MFITFFSPLVKTKELFYTFREPRDVVRIHVGYISENSNSEIAIDVRKWFLYNKKREIVRSGEASVKLGSFDSFIDLANLTSGEIYIFSIENPEALPTTTIISSIDTGLIKVIDETHRFTGNPITFGDITCVLININGSILGERKAQLPLDWNITRTNGNGLIFSNGRIYAYMPKAFYTRNRQAPSHIDFTPFPGLSTKRIPVHQLPTIQNEGNRRYSINPASRVVATWETGTFDSRNPITLLDLSLYDFTNIKIAVIFP